MKVSFSSVLIALSAVWIAQATSVHQEQEQVHRRRAQGGFADYYIPHDHVTHEFSDFSPAFMETGIDGEDCPSENGLQSVVAGISCSGVSCRAMKLHCVYEGTPLLKTTGPTYTTLGLTEQDGEGHSCPHNYVMTGLVCTGKFCGSMHLECQKMANLELDYTDCDESEPISTESSMEQHQVYGQEHGMVMIHPSGFPVGLRCEGAFCETKYIRYCMAPWGSFW